MHACSGVCVCVCHHIPMIFAWNLTFRLLPFLPLVPRVISSCSTPSWWVLYSHVTFTPPLRGGQGSSHRHLLTYTMQFKLIKEGVGRGGTVQSSAGTLSVWLTAFLHQKWAHCGIFPWLGCRTYMLVNNYNFKMWLIATDLRKYQ